MERKIKRKLMYEYLDKAEKGDEEAIEAINRIWDIRKTTRKELRKPIKAIYKNGTVETFDRIGKCAAALKLNEYTIAQHLKRGTKTKMGISFELITDEFSNVNNIRKLEETDEQ